MNTFQIASDTGAPLHGIVQAPRKSGRRPTVVICHGFKGFMEWGFFPPLADLLVERGFTVVRFNYSGAGMRPGDDVVTDLGAFRRNTFSQELAETSRILRALDGEIAHGRVDLERLGLFGHSRGGGAAILAAALPEWQKRLRALVTWAAVSTFDRFGDDSAMKAAWRESGAIEIKNARTGQALELGTELLADLEENSDALDPVRAAGERTAPWLIVHGNDDETVPAAEAERLAAAASGDKELFILAEANHTFGARHPFAGPTPELIEAMNATQTWFRRHLTA